MADEMSIKARCGALADATQRTACQEGVQKCSDFDDMASKTSCWELIQSCLDQAKDNPDTYTLATPGGNPWISANQLTCFMDSEWIVRNLGPIGTNSQSNSAGNRTDDAARTNEPFVPDGQTRFATGFSDADNFRPKITTSKESQKITLRFLYNGSLKGMNIVVTYTIREIASHRYSMEYEIADQRGNAIGAKRTIELSAPGNRIEAKLGFGVVLYNEGDFGQVKWIGIVRL